MSAKEASKKQVSRNIKEANEFDVGKLKLFYPVLGSCILDRNDSPEKVNEAKPERFYDAAIHLIVRPVDSLNVGVCEFSAGQKIKGKIILQIDATYFIAFDIGKTIIQDRDKKNLVEEMASTSAWPLFRDLFIHIGSQSGEELPLLPNVPKLRWLKPHNEVRKGKSGKKK